MSTTGTIIHDSLPLESPKTAALTLLALNLAIRAAWPSIKISEYATSVATLVATTYEYSLAAVTPAPDPKLGIAQVFIVENTTLPEVSHEAVWQRYDHSDGFFKLVFAPDITRAYPTKTVNILYQRPHTAITALTDTIELPDHYLTAYCMAWYATKILSKQTVDLGGWRDIRHDNQEDWQQALRDNHTSLMPTLGWWKSDGRRV